LVPLYQELPEAETAVRRELVQRIAEDLWKEMGDFCEVRREMAYSSQSLEYQEVTSRLAVMPLQDWHRIEEFLMRKGFDFQELNYYRNPNFLRINSHYDEEEAPL
jgi:hypothetical protein